MGLRLRVFGAVGTLATLLAAGLLLVPDLLLAFGPVTAMVAAAGKLDPKKLLLAGSLLVGLYLSIAARSATETTTGGAEPDAFDAATADPPEAVTTHRQRRTAEGLADRIDDAVDGDETARDAVVARLRETATAAYARAADVGPEAAREAVERGTWTEDRTAAAFLSDSESPSHSVWSRLRLWLDAETERERRLRRTISVTNDLAEGWR